MWYKECKEGSLFISYNRYRRASGGQVFFIILKKTKRGYNFFSVVLTGGTEIKGHFNHQKIY